MAREFIRSGETGDDGWIDITCVGARFQEQYRRRAGENEFRYRPTMSMVQEYPDARTTIAHMTVEACEEWRIGPSPDGCGRGFVQHQAAA